ncbi:MAG TPA: prepilin peptidase [Firmicutes bacterium]|nr:prepilin peptidase [Bacillota bacterium]
MIKVVRVTSVGLLLGSFLNVCIYRIPRGESIVFPPSHCPQCQHRLGPLELIPLLSFLWQRGRCRHCSAPISWRYPLVELLAAVLLSIVYLRFGWSPELVYYSGLTALLLVISFIDLDTMVIPTQLVGVGVVWASAYNIYTRQPLLDWLLAGALGYGLFYLIYILSRGGMGGGDVRLAGLLGVVLGLKQLACALLIAFVAGAIVSLLLLASGRANRKTAIPFGPFLAIGCYVAAMWGQSILNWYSGLFF